MTRIRLIAGLSICLAAVALLGLFLISEADPQAPMLQTGSPYQGRFVDSNTKEKLRTHLQEGAFVQIDVEQIGVDLSAALFDPSGQLLLMIDNPTGAFGFETLWIVAEKTGVYELELAASNPLRENRFQVQIKPLPFELRELAVACRLVSEGYRLERLGTAGALEQYSKALRIWERHSRRQQESYALSRIGKAHYYRAQYEQATSYFEKALDLVDENRAYSTAIFNLVYLGLIHAALGNQEAAYESYQRVIDISRQAEYSAGVAFGHFGIGNCLAERGQYEAAIQSYQEALSIWQRAGEQKRSLNLQLQLAQIYSYLGRSDFALDLLVPALDQARKLAAKDSEASALVWTGWAHYQQGDMKKAIQAGQQALELLEGHDAYQLIGDSYWGYGEQIKRDGDPAQAGKQFSKSLGYLQSALDHARKGKEPLKESNYLAHMARTHTSLHQYDRALQLAKKALEICSQHEYPEIEMFSLFVKSKALFGLKRLQQARKEMEAALKMLDGLHEGTGAGSNHIQFLDLRYSMHEYYLQVLMEMHRRQPDKGYNMLALQANDRSRARNFLDSMAEARVGVRQAADPGLLMEEREAQQRLRRKERERRALLNRSHRPEELASITRDIRQLEQACNQIAARIRRNHPKYADMMNPDSVSLNEVQQTILDSGTLLLVYAFGESDLFAWLVGQDFARSFKLGKRAPIERLSKQLIDDFKRPASPLNRVPRQNRLTKLSGYLVAPLKQHLGSYRLAIVADGPLNYVPFNILLQEAPDQRGGTGRPLIADHEIVILPSISTLVALRRQLDGPRAASKTIAVLADPIFNSKDKRLNRSPALGGRSEDSAITTSAGTDLTRLKRLAYTKEEADAILAMAPHGQGRSALGLEANKQALEDLAKYRILHFATHAFIYPEHPDLSGIVLTQFYEDGQPRDGFLQAHEIYDLDLAAELVVLSACETAQGQVFRGEGIVGFTRGFMFAGSPRIIVSLWKVHDQATFELMKTFYRHLFEGADSPSAALRKAQLRLLKSPEWSDPYYWGAFMLQGEWANDLQFSASGN